MKPEIIAKLLAINRQFYQTFAEAFDATRQRVQPGVAQVLERLLETLPRGARILDLGCGNGQVARELARRGFRGTYVGVDFSEGLLEAARETCQVSENLTGLSFFQRDLTAPDWELGLEGLFDVVLAFAVFHHLPGMFHGGIMRKVRALLNPHPSTTSFTFPKPQVKPSAQDALLLSFSPCPLFIFSNWQFLNSPRWRARIQPWERAGLTPDEVDANDYLLDWRRGGEGLRYVHHFSEPELVALAQEAGFEVTDTFTSDGAEGNLGMYQIWRPV